MSDEKQIAVTNNSTQLTVKSLFNQENVKQKFNELLGKKAPGFITSVLQSVASNDLLKKADPNTVFHAAAVAATLDLPINNNLGFAYIVPYNDRKAGKCVAQFQMGYKGFIQLAQRSGQFLTISAAPIYEGQLITENPLTGFEFDFSKKKSEKIIGYAAYFKLLNGFEKTLYMTADDLNKHGQKFSQSFRKGYGLWKDDFDSMAQKTVMKLLLSKFAPLSIEMQTAVKVDQAVIKDSQTEEIEYVDASHSAQLLSPEEIEHDRIMEMINDCKTIEDVEDLRLNNPDIDNTYYQNRFAELKGAKK